MKWGGAVVSVLLVVVWIGSGWICLERRGVPDSYALEAGSFHYDTWNQVGREWGIFTDGWEICRRTTPFRWWYRWESPRGTIFRDIPIWPVAMSSLIAAIAAWRLEVLAHKRSSTTCSKCSYSRTGLPRATVCPECGAAAPTGVARV